ncbi:MAG: aminodeoxychorismate synthase component I [Helicobacteraceae bacterium]|jgi:para-aminobenzoate synthetase component 1|nr:aminodeoxychorismate synthase component I [Helicobacteraceae bacterium]
MYDKISHLAANGIPFLLISDFKAEKILVYTYDELVKEDIEFNFTPTARLEPTPLIKKPIDFRQYKIGFDKIIEHIKAGETYLLNYTCSTPVETPLTIKEIYHRAHAKFKLRFKDEFVCFSPERFIKIEGETISTYPMKGTIDAALPNAKERILHNEKEMAEHIMVVDLLRNDLGIVASNIKVESFRYIDHLYTGDKELLQVSSKITGRLPIGWQKNFGTIIASLLPAGSISGTPKKSTVEIIEEVEEHKRGFFTGIFGYFDGKDFDIAVMIRFIEKRGEQLIYKSGGGITLESSAIEEYQEMLHKIYIP